MFDFLIYALLGVLPEAIVYAVFLALMFISSV